MAGDGILVTKPRRAAIFAGGLFIACVLTLAPLMAPAVSAGSASNGGLSVGPCAGDAHSYFILGLSPGQTYTNCLTIHNTSHATETVSVYPVDGLTGVTSGAVYSNNGTRLTGEGTWMTVSQPTLTLPPAGTTNDSFTITVPAGATPGDHLGGIAVQPDHTTTSKGQFAITIVDRFVIATLVTLPGNNSVNFNITSAHIMPLEATNSASITLALTDTGDLLGQSAITVTLTKPGYDKTSASTLGTILPGDTIPYPFRWPYAIPVGHYTITVTDKWTSDTTQMSRTWVFNGSVSAALPPTVSNVEYVKQKVAAPVSPVVWIIIAVVAILLIVALFFIVALIRTQRKLQAKLASPDHPEQT